MLLPHGCVTGQCLGTFPARPELLEGGNGSYLQGVLTLYSSNTNKTEHNTTPEVLAAVLSFCLPMRNNELATFTSFVLK